MLTNEQRVRKNLKSKERYSLNRGEILRKQRLRYKEDIVVQRIRANEYYDIQKMKKKPTANYLNMRNQELET